jgi:hypothetical protein
MARQKNHSSVSKPSGPRGTTTAGEIRTSRTTVAKPKASKATVALGSNIIKEINKIRKCQTNETDQELKAWKVKPNEYDYLYHYSICKCPCFSDARPDPVL